MFVYHSLQSRAILHFTTNASSSPRFSLVFNEVDGCNFVLQHTRPKLFLVEGFVIAGRNHKTFSFLF